MRGLATVPRCVLQLDQICISFDKGKTTMNFIEAALLIQGSACVYSKKVGPPGCGLELQCLVGLRSTVFSKPFLSLRPRFGLGRYFFWVQATFLIETCIGQNFRSLSISLVLQVAPHWSIQASLGVCTKCIIQKKINLRLPKA